MWQADFGEFHLAGKRLYLLVILDDFSGVIVGHCLADSLKAEVVVHALREAVAGHGKPEALRTDRGSAFVSKKLRCYLEAEQIDHVAGRCSGLQRDKVESVFATVRRELRDSEQLESVPVAVSRLRSLFERSKERDIRKGRRVRHGVESK